MINWKSEENGDNFSFEWFCEFDKTEKNKKNFFFFLLNWNFHEEEEEQEESKDAQRNN